jgi:hypothetical protein
MYFNRFSSAAQPPHTAEETTHPCPSYQYAAISSGASSNTTASHSSSSQGHSLFDVSLNGSESQDRQQADPFVSQEEELVDERLLRYLSAMTRTLRDARKHHLDEEDRVRLLMCRELLTVGYRHVKQKMDRGDLPLGDLHYGSAWTFVRVGPVTDFVAPHVDVEMMWCWNQKAIKIIARWPTFDDFYDVWNGVLGRDAGVWDQMIVVREYSSVDHGYKHKYPVYPMTTIVELDKIQLGKYWMKASGRVKALIRIDELKD